MEPALDRAVDESGGPRRVLAVAGLRAFPTRPVVLARDSYSCREQSRVAFRPVRACAKSRGRCPGCVRGAIDGWGRRQIPARCGAEGREDGANGCIRVCMGVVSAGTGTKSVTHPCPIALKSGARGRAADGGVCGGAGAPPRRGGLHRRAHLQREAGEGHRGHERRGDPRETVRIEQESELGNHRRAGRYRRGRVRSRGDDRLRVDGHRLHGRQPPALRPRRVACTRALEHVREGAKTAADVTIWSADMTVVEYGSRVIGAGTAALFSNQAGRVGPRGTGMERAQSSHLRARGLRNSGTNSVMHRGPDAGGLPRAVKRGRGCCLSSIRLPETSFTASTERGQFHHYYQSDGAAMCYGRLGRCACRKCVGHGCARTRDRALGGSRDFNRDPALAATSTEAVHSSTSGRWRQLDECLWGVGP